MIAVVVLGLGAAIIYGVSDFFGAFAARRIHLVTATLVNYAIATVGIFVAVWIVGGAWSGAAVWTGTVTGVLAVFGLLTFYGVLAVGPMSLLSPLIALIQSVIPVIAAVITGQPFTPVAWVAVIVGIAALLLLSPRPEPGRQRITLRAAVLAVASGVLFGISLVTLDFAPKNSGVVPSVFEIVAGLVVLCVAWLVLRLLPRGNAALSFLEPSPENAATLSLPRAWLAVVISGGTVAAADAFIVLDLHIGNLAIVSVLVALYPVLTVILAATVLKERMTRLQFVAVGLVIIASLLFSSTST